MSENGVEDWVWCKGNTCGFRFSICSAEAWILKTFPFNGVEPILV